MKYCLCCNEFVFFIDCILSSHDILESFILHNRYSFIIKVMVVKAVVVHMFVDISVIFKLRETSNMSNEINISDIMVVCTFLG